MLAGWAVTDVVLDLISASAISRALSADGFSKDATVGRQRRPYEPLARTGGFRVTQGPRWRVEVWQRAADAPERAAVYAGMTATLTGRGYRVEHNAEVVRDELRVTRLRAPTAGEWAVLDRLAGSPLMLEAPQLREAYESGTEGLSADVLDALHRSGLLAIGTSIPTLRDPRLDTRPISACVLSLSAAGVALLVRRNEARQARAMWAVIAPDQRDGEPPPLLTCDPARR